MSNYQQRVSKDRFGNDYILVGLKDKKGTGFPKGYAEIKGQLYKIEFSESKKEGTEGWVKLTKVVKQKSSGQF